MSKKYAALAVGKFFLALILVLPAQVFGQNNYQAFIDLNKVVNDKLKVTVQVPQISEDEIEYHIPKIVPGTYSIYDFGRFVSNFEAFDVQGRPLLVEELTPNRRLIKDARRLTTLSYWVEDTYDTQQKNFVFEPAGTNIQKDKNFIINNYAFIGYLENYKNLPYELTIKHPSALFGATGLMKAHTSDSVDVFKAPNYFDLADGPIMYCEPDTAMFQVGNTEILVSVYSPNKIAKSDLIAGYIKETIAAQRDYLKGKLPVDRYAFLIYHYPGIFSGSMKLGALEHSYSSLYSLPERHPIINSQYLIDFTAHEFFHIITPLNLHSEEIGNFDFINPQMSKHLWLYEGVTEYAAGLAQVKYGSMDSDTYLEVLLKKIKSSQKYRDDLPFTELSEKCLTTHKSQYGNVYQKGALIAMCIDIILQKQSAGQYGIQELIEELSDKYGKVVSFKDDELFETIETITYPEIGRFLEQYIAGNQALPLNEIFSHVGVTYTPKMTKVELSLGNIAFSANEKDNSVTITDVLEMNDFGKEMGFQEGDVFFKFDGKTINAENFSSVFDSFKTVHEPGDQISAVVYRKSDNGKMKKVKLEGTAIQVKIRTNLELKWDSSASKGQLALRKSWINK